MHPSYFNNPEIANAWKKPAVNNRKAINLRERFIALGLITPAKDKQAYEPRT